uniref:Uncharacterized protein n=1 Tax=Anguilla anguilla TaxID=7936 RepID=A0A0E9PV54_ANGAN
MRLCILRMDTVYTAILTTFT